LSWSNFCFTPPSIPIPTLSTRSVLSRLLHLDDVSLSRAPLRMPAPPIELHRCATGLAHPFPHRPDATRLPAPATFAGAGAGGRGESGRERPQLPHHISRCSSITCASHLFGRWMWKLPHRWYASLSLPRFHDSQSRGGIAPAPEVSMDAREQQPLASHGDEGSHLGLLHVRDERGGMRDSHPSGAE
jgi:hypothetical protein